MWLVALENLGAVEAIVMFFRILGDLGRSDRACKHGVSEVIWPKDDRAYMLRRAEMTKTCLASSQEMI